MYCERTRRHLQRLWHRHRLPERHDLRTVRNLAGATATYEAFRPWLHAKGEMALDQVPGEALPPPPAIWSSVNPTETDRATPFGALFTLVEKETGHTGDALVAAMLKAADALGIPQLPGN